MELTKMIDDFADIRDWTNNDPNQLITSIYIELGELAEHHQWKDKFEKFDEDEKKEIGFEYVDVLFYLFRLASKSGIDIEKYFDEKFEKLKIKFPIGSDCKTQHNLYRSTGKNKKYE
jgi:NTP pyrophosphatase (non-canonical NTP hydrolase)